MIRSEAYIPRMALLNVVAGAAPVLIGVPGPFRPAPNRVRSAVGLSPAFLPASPHRKRRKSAHSLLFVNHHHHHRQPQSPAVVINIVADDALKSVVAVPHIAAARSTIATAAHAPPIISHRNFRSPFPPFLLISSTDTLTPTLPTARWPTIFPFFSSLYHIMPYPTIPPSPPRPAAKSTTSPMSGVKRTSGAPGAI